MWEALGTGRPLLVVLGSEQSRFSAKAAITIRNTEYSLRNKPKTAHFSSPHVRGDTKHMGMATVPKHGGGSGMSSVATGKSIEERK